MDEIIGKLKNALQSRRIAYNIYEFKSDSVVVISTIKGRKMSINLAHQIIRKEDGSYIVSDYNREYAVGTESSVSSRIITLIRKAEMTFSKYTVK